MQRPAMNIGEYQALPINWSDAPAAYPLVYLHDASISLDFWLTFVGRYVDSSDEGCGLIAIRDLKAIAHALFAYRVELDIKGARQLCIAQLIVAQIPGSQIARAVIAATEQIAFDLDCVRIVIERPFDLTPAVAAEAV